MSSAPRAWLLADPQHPEMDCPYMLEETARMRQREFPHRVLVPLWDSSSDKEVVNVVAELQKELDSTRRALDTLTRFQWNDSDRFAIAALQGYLAGAWFGAAESLEPSGNVDRLAMATRCYQFADAMMIARRQRDERAQQLHTHLCGGLPIVATE
jgi:hypothetical protein